MGQRGNPLQFFGIQKESATPVCALVRNDSRVIYFSRIMGTLLAERAALI